MKEEVNHVWLCDDLRTGAEVKDLRKYKAYYCGLCRKLKEDYGTMGQMTLTYDMTFAIILLASLYLSLIHI